MDLQTLTARISADQPTSAFGPLTCNPDWVPAAAKQRFESVAAIRRESALGQQAVGCIQGL